MNSKSNRNRHVFTKVFIMVAIAGTLRFYMLIHKEGESHHLLSPQGNKIIGEYKFISFSEPQPVDHHVNTLIPKALPRENHKISVSPNETQTEATCNAYAFIHVGKNGGTTISSFFHTDGKPFQPHNCCSHDTKVLNVPNDVCFVTLARDPIERWVSGYLSRWRYGCPTYCHRITAEEWIWNDFPSPNHLAEALYSDNETVSEKAQMAVQQSKHMREGYASYFSHLGRNMSRVSYVGLTCDLDNDLLPLALISAKSYPDISQDYVRLAVQSYKERIPTPMHQNQLKVMEYLSPLARKNLKKHLKEDYAVMKIFAEHGLISSMDVEAECKKRGKFSSRISRQEWEEFMKDGRDKKVQRDFLDMINKKVEE